MSVSPQMKGHRLAFGPASTGEMSLPRGLKLMREEDIETFITTEGRKLLGLVSVTDND